MLKSADRSRSGSMVPGSNNVRRRSRDPSKWNCSVLDDDCEIGRIPEESLVQVRDAAKLEDLNRYGSFKEYLNDSDSAMQRIASTAVKPFLDSSRNLIDDGSENIAPVLNDSQANASNTQFDEAEKVRVLDDPTSLALQMGAIIQSRDEAKSVESLDKEDSVGINEGNSIKD